MRLILTGLAAAIVVALFAALVGPNFIDWSAHKPALEARLSQALGLAVTLDGPIDITLLPSPRLSAGGASVAGRAGGAALLTCEAARFELSAPSLMRGEWRFVEARLEKPVLTLTLDTAGRLEAPSGGEDVAAVVDALTIVDGAVVLKAPDGAERARLDRINLSGSADGLAGPFKAQGRIGVGKTGFRVTTGAAQGGKLRLKAVIDASAETPRAEFDGVATLSGVPGYEGQMALDGAFAEPDRPAAPWRLTGALKAGAQGASLDPLDVKIGAEERPLAITGRAGVDAQGARLSLSARQVDLDRMLGANGEVATPRTAMTAAADVWRELARRAERLAEVPIAVDLTPGVVTLGGEAVADASLSFSRAPGEAPTLRVETSLPGRSHVVAEGRLDIGAAARFRGRIEATSGDARRLRDWLGDLLPSGVKAPFATISVKAAAEVSEVSLSLRGAEARLDRTPLKGDVIYVAPVAGERGRFFADLVSDALDIDGAPDLTALIGAAPDHDFSLTLDARAARVARFGGVAVDAGRIRLAARRENGRAELERLSVERLGGANLTAEGSLDAEGGRFALDLDAERLGDLAALIERLAPGAASAALKTRAARLSPAKLTIKAQAGPGFALRSGTATGVFAGARVEARAQANADGVASQIEIAQDDVAALLRQFGLDASGPPRLGPAKIVAAFDSAPDGRVNARARAQAPGAALSFEGGFSMPALLAGEPQGLGLATLDAENVAPLLTAASVLAPGGFARGGADVAARLATTREGVALQDLRGWAFGTRVAGSALARAASSESPRMRIEGRLEMERLALPDVAALTLGFAPPDAAVRSPWSDRAFAPGLSPYAPDVSMELDAARLDTGVAGETGPARARLVLAPGVAKIEGLDAPLAGGRLSADLAWRRDRLEAGFTGKLALRGARIDAAPAAFTIDADLDAAGSGRNPAALVAALGGEGRATFVDLTLRRAASGAIATAVRDVEAQTIQLDKGALERALTARLDAGGRSPAEPTQTALTLATGVVRAAPVTLDGPHETLAAGATLDVRTMTLEARETFTATSRPSHWSGSPPSFDAYWRGPLAGAATREVEAGAFLNGLSARSLALELERVEALEADIAERAMFSRRQKAWDFMRRRDSEIAAFEIEQARREEEARKLEEMRAAEDARREAARKAEETRRASEERRAEAARRAEEERRADEALAAEARAAATRREMQKAIEALSAEPPLRGEPPLTNAPASK